MSTPRPRIQRLPVQLANQIAAGEVVERPASVVKELVENAVDAGADRIEVEIAAGGEQLIRIRDNGGGIARDELALALSRHATSKVTSLSDLERIASLGFRGEALASIASVSRLSLISRTVDEASAWMLRGDCPETAAPEPAAHPPGTSVEVRDLFHNTPARRKFLRSQRTEFAHVLEVVKRIALSRYELALSLRHNGRNVLDLAPAPDRAACERRLARIFGPAFLRHGRFLEFEAGELRLWGWVATPGFTRSQQDLQYFYVNGRSVRDRVVTHAVRRAFENTLPEGRQPAYVLYLELDPLRVDVNVHPTKHEVRFREARLVHDFIVSRLERALRDPMENASAPAFDSAPPAESRAQSVRGERAAPARPRRAVAEPRQSYRALHGSGARASAPRSGRLGRPLGRVGRYLLTETAGQVLALDLRAAGGELFRARLTPAPGECVRSQPLLLPVSLQVPESQAGLVETPGSELRDLGFDLERAGPDTVLVRGMPAPLARLESAPLVATVLAERAAGTGLQDLREALARAGADQLPGGIEPDRLLQDLQICLGESIIDSRFCRALSEQVLARLFDTPKHERSSA